MYSRYIPNGRGGFDRQTVPGGPDPPRGPGPPPADLEPEAPPRPQEPEHAPGSTSRPVPKGPMGPRPPSPRPEPGRLPPAPGRQQFPAHGSPPHPGSMQPGSAFPGRGGMPGRGRPPGPSGLLGSLLGRSLDLDDLLILAILVLTMRSDGADGLTIAIAAGLYFFL